MIFIQKIFEDQIDDVVRRKFERFSIGIFEKRALIKVSKGKDLKIKASYDLADDLFGIIANNIEGKVKVKGKIISSRDFSGEIDFEVEKFTKGKKFTAEIDTEVSSLQLKEIYEKFKLNFILLNVEGDGFSLKVGKSLPKPGSVLKDNFCKAVFPLEIVKELVWDVDNFKKAVCEHKLIIDEVIAPEGVSSAEARKLAKRKGKLVRKIDVGGKEIVKEKEFTI